MFLTEGFVGREKQQHSKEDKPEGNLRIRGLVGLESCVGDADDDEDCRKDGEDFDGFEFHGDDRRG